MTSRKTAFCSGKLALFCLTVGVAAAFVPAPAKAVPSGSYERSCRDIREAGDPRRPEVSAECRDTRGNFRFSSLLYGTCRGQVSNNNGQLVCDGGRPGSATPYDNDQRDYNGRADDRGRNYSGRPEDDRYGNSGDYRRPDAGRSAYNDNDANLPGGSWAQSCRDAEVSGTVLTAQCSRDNRWFDARLDLRSCRTGRAGNRLGQLICE